MKIALLSILMSYCEQLTLTLRQTVGLSHVK